MRTALPLFRSPTLNSDKTCIPVGLAVRGGDGELDSPSLPMQGVRLMMLLNSLVLKAYTKGRKFVTGKDEGASLAEYAMLLAVVTVALIASITAFAGVIKTVFDDTGAQLKGAAGS